tara:strand:+ start:4276 stop:6678 length:2403 start_codon:yes stop_codon:yes gene_type:complete
MPPRTSPSSQNPGPGSGGPGANNPAQPQTPTAGAAPAPAGLNPDPNPKVVVRAINPPLTPDQVVSQAETPASASLPEIKLEKIKLPRVQNKSIVGYLKAIEAKMTATEKLMKDVVKLQNLQIVTQKELHERKRELYQNTFEEYLIDKTIGFGDDPDDPDCTCINLPKKPDGGFPFAGGKKRRKRQRQPVNAPIAIPIPIKEPVTEREGSDEGQGLPARPKTEPRTPQVPREEEDPFRLPDFPQIPIPFPPPLIPGNPFEFDPFEFPGLPMGAAADIDPAAAFTNPELAKATSGLFDYESLSPLSFIDPKQDPAIAEVEEFRTWVPQDQVPSPLLAFVPDALKAYEANGKRTTSVDTPHGTLYVGFNNTFDRTPVFKYLTNTGNADRMAETAKTLDNPFVSSVLTGTQGLNFVGDIMMGGRGRVGAASRGPYGINSYRRGLKPFNLNVPNLNLKSNFAKQYSRARTGLTDAKTNLQNRFIRDPNKRTQTPDQIIRDAEDGFNPYSARARKDFEDASFDSDLVRFMREGDMTIQRGNIPADQLDLLNQPTKQASGGISSTNLYDSSAKQYFRGISNDMTIPNFGGGGLVNWWNMGRNMRVPTENTANWRSLMADDAKQLTRTNKAFKSGATGIRGWNPIKAFTPEMVKTGPTPAVRQAFERPVRAIRDNIIRSTVVRAAKPILAPLVKPLVAASALILATPTPAGGALYGPGAVDPKYRNVTSREEYDKLEAAQSNMMQSGSGNTPQVVPLPPNYIQIPGRKKKAQTKTKTGFNAPGIDIEQSPFGRSDTTLDSSFNGMFGF